MDIIEAAILMKLGEYRSKAGRDVFLLPESCDVTLFINMFDECIKFYDNVDDKINISEYFSVLTDRQKDIITKIHLEGYTFDEVAIMYNVSRQAANFAATKGIKKIKQIFASESE